MPMCSAYYTIDMLRTILLDDLVAAILVKLGYCKEQEGAEGSKDHTKVVSSWYDNKSTANGKSC